MIHKTFADLYVDAVTEFENNTEYPLSYAYKYLRRINQLTPSESVTDLLKEEAEELSMNVRDTARHLANIEVSRMAVDKIFSRIIVQQGFVTHNLIDINKRRADGYDRLAGYMSSKIDCLACASDTESPFINGPIMAL